MGQLCAVSFNRYGRLYYFDPGELRPSVGDRVLVPTDDGPEVAECVWAAAVGRRGHRRLPEAASGWPATRTCAATSRSARAQGGREGGGQAADPRRTSCR